MPYITREDNISKLPLSVRSMNCLHSTGINTIGAMIDYPIEELINIRNMGKKSVAEIQNFIQAIKDGTCGEYILVKESERSSLSQEEDLDADSGKVFFLDEQGLRIQDIPIEKLHLSRRAENCLLTNDFRYISQLIEKTYTDLLNIKNMGKKTAEEILSCIERVTVKQRACTTKNYETDDFSNNLAKEMYSVYGETENIWLKEILTVKSQYPEAIGENLINCIYNYSTLVQKTIKPIILKIIEENNNKSSIKFLEDALPSHLNNTTILKKILFELESIFAIEIKDDEMIYRQYPSVVEFAAHIEDERIREVVQGKIAGKTLQEIGDSYGVTRERVRQILVKGLRNKPQLREDKYICLYENYNFSIEEFTYVFDEPKETYHYLEMICSGSHSSKKQFDEILMDEKISPEYRKKAERVIYKKYITIDGVLIKMTRRDLVKHYIKNNCRTLTKFDDFFNLYHIWLEELGMKDNNSLQLDLSYRNFISICDYVLWSQGQSFRYYNMKEHDFEELLSTIDLNQYENIELSTFKLFKDYPELMKQYDIHDEYELHNLLKKISKNSNIKFNRMPTIEIGKANRDNQVFSLFLECAPIGIDELAERYEEEYGAKAATVKGSFFKVLDDYYHNGSYRIDYDSMNSNELKRMKEILIHDFYTIKEIKRLYKREFSSSNESQLINPYNLKALDFRVYSGYVIKNTYPTASDYFRYLFTKDDIFDARNLSSSIQGVMAYNSELYKLCTNYEIIEFLPRQYINIRKLNKFDITVEILKKYSNAVFNNYEKGDFFTITSLRQEGFTHEMDKLGFDDWFYASILVEDKEHFSYQRSGGTRVFRCGKTGANLGGLLVWLLEKKQKIDIYDFKDLLENHYGIIISKERLLVIIAGTELYYDAIMEAVYIDYETYFEEI